MSNREIKFRAWDRYECEFVDVWASDYAHHTDDKDINVIFGDSIKVFQQYTGLKDKNGVEIYEGDIVGCKQQGRIKKGIVEWKDGMWNWTYDTKSGNTTWLFGAIEKWKPEILGNIYENNNLLEEKK